MTRTRLRAGAAKVDITPDITKIRIQLGGYNARLNMPPTGVHDPIYARALALEVGEQTAVIVALDHLLIPWSLTRNVLQATGLQPAQLFMSASHTHCAPDSMGLNERMRFPLPGVGTFLPEFLAFTTERVVQAIRQARQRMRPATLALAAAELPNLNRNRRGRRLLDRTMTVARLDDSRGKPFAAVVVFAAHPTIYPHTMMQVSAEFPGVVQTTLEGVLGRGAVALFLNGALGDVSPVADVGKDHHERVRIYGASLAAHAQRLLRDAQPAPARLRVLTRPARRTLPQASTPDPPTPATPPPAPQQTTPATDSPRLAHLHLNRPLVHIHQPHFGHAQREVVLQFLAPVGVGVRRREDFNHQVGGELQSGLLLQVCPVVQAFAREEKQIGLARAHRRTTNHKVKRGVKNLAQSFRSEWRDPAE
jgi:hypothetical protein